MKPRLTIVTAITEAIEQQNRNRRACGLPTIRETYNSGPERRGTFQPRTTDQNEEAANARRRALERWRRSFPKLGIHLGLGSDFDVVEIEE